MRGSAVPYITHGHYYLKHADASPPGMYGGSDDQLLYVAPGDDEGGGVFVTTGTFFGPVEITVETFDSADAAAALDGDWEITQEVTLTARGANLRVEVADGGTVIDLPQLQLAPGDPAGVRIQARGVDAVADVQEIALEDGPIEHHHLQLWRR
jgi:hypothetical protein